MPLVTLPCVNEASNSPSSSNILHAWRVGGSAALGH